MKFFFPDSQDFVDPSFDFLKETRSEHRVRQHHDLYAHEVLHAPPYDGLLVSKAIVFGFGASGSRYTEGQRRRFQIEGVRKYFRLDNQESTRHLKTLGDCGAFSYVKEHDPPYSVEAVLEFYESCGFDYGVSIDHIILAHTSEPVPQVDPDWKRRQELTLELADQFFKTHHSQKCRFVPFGVSQGWNANSHAHAVAQLQKVGYKHIAIGGLVPLRSKDVLTILHTVHEVLRPTTRLHLFGITRLDHLERFSDYGVWSIDSTTPLKCSFKDDKENYLTLDGSYTAIRVPQTDGNPRLAKSIASGKCRQELAVGLEKQCLSALRQYDKGKLHLDKVLRALNEYESLFGKGKKMIESYRRVLADMPWKRCSCEICKHLGIEVIIFRGAERNRRRGFHNLHVFSERLSRRPRTN